MLLSESGIFLLFYYVVVRCYYLLIPEENCIWCWFIDTDHFFRKNIKPKTGKKLWYLAHNRRYLLSSRLSFSIEEVKVTNTDHVTPMMVGSDGRERKHIVWNSPPSKLDRETQGLPLRNTTYEKGVSFV